MSTTEKDVQPVGFVQPGALAALASGPVTGRHQISARRDLVNGFTQPVFTSVDKHPVNQITQDLENVNQATDIPVVAQSPYSEVRVKNIDAWIKTLENAKRYEWLRDVAFDTPRQDLVPRDKSGNMLIEQDLDSEVDLAMKAHPGEQEVEPCAD